MFAEAIDVILAIWAGEAPYDIDLPDTRYKVSIARTAALAIGVGYMAKPYQQPRPEIVGTVVAPFSPGVVLIGKRDFHPLSANFLLSRHLRSHWQNYCKGKAEAGVEPDVADWRVARAIFVADDDKVAARYGREDADSPYGFYYSQMLAKMTRGKRLYVFKSHKDQPDEEITRFRHGPLRDPRQRQPRGGPNPRPARGDRRFRRARLCRHGLGRSSARQPVDAADGRAGHAGVNAAIGKAAAA